MTSIAVLDDHMLQDISPRTLSRRPRGRAFVATHRHGKHLFIHISNDGWLRLHFGMTGDLKYLKQGGRENAHTRLRIDFVNGYHLVFRSIRRFSQIGWVDAPESFVELAGLGPDALDPDLDSDAFREAVKKRRGAVKSALMD